jgi:hypothetical protein
MHYDPATNGINKKKLYLLAQNTVSEELGKFIETAERIA